MSAVLTIREPHRILNELLFKYRVWEDPVSIKLRKNIERINKTNTIDIDERLRRFFFTASEKILVNPLNEDFMLSEPILDRKWVWERQYLERYLRAADGEALSPFDDQPIVTKTHEFAVEVLRWIKEYRHKFTIEEPAPLRNMTELLATGANAVVSQVNLKDFSLMCEILAKKYIQIEFTRIKCKQLKVETCVLMHQTKKTQSEILLLQKSNHEAKIELKDNQTAAPFRISDANEETITMLSQIAEATKVDIVIQKEKLEEMLRLAKAEAKRADELRNELSNLKTF